MSIFDKLLWGVLILILLLAVAAGFLFGLPSSIPDVALKSEKITMQELEINLTPEQKAVLNERKTCCTLRRVLGQTPRLWTKNFEQVLGQTPRLWMKNFEQVKPLQEKHREPNHTDVLNLVRTKTVRL